MIGPLLQYVAIAEFGLAVVALPGVDRRQAENRVDVGCLLEQNALVDEFGFAQSALIEQILRLAQTGIIRGQPAARYNQQRRQHGIQKYFFVHFGYLG